MKRCDGVSKPDAGKPSDPTASDPSLEIIKDEILIGTERATRPVVSRISHRVDLNTVAAGADRRVSRIDFTRLRKCIATRGRRVWFFVCTMYKCATTSLARACCVCVCVSEMCEID